MCLLEFECGDSTNRFIFSALFTYPYVLSLEQPTCPLLPQLCARVQEKLRHRVGVLCMVSLAL